jgi:hypothetical protein
VTAGGRDGDDLRDRGRRIVLEGLAAAGLDVEQVSPDTWVTSLSGEWKRTIPVMLRVDERSLHVRSLLVGEPDEGHAAVYRYLLQRNQKPLPIHFALDDEGDVVMTGGVPLPALDPAVFDRLLGVVLTTADEVFNAVLRLGFGGYIAAEQRWRAANSLPPNPVSGGDARA